MLVELSPGLTRNILFSATLPKSSGGGRPPASPFSGGFFLQLRPAGSTYTDIRSSAPSQSALNMGQNCSPAALAAPDDDRLLRGQTIRRPIIPATRPLVVGVVERISC